MKHFEKHFLSALLISIWATPLSAHPGHATSEKELDEPHTEASVAPILVGLDHLIMAGDKSRASSKATLRPSRKMDVLEFEVGVEIGSRAFHGAYKGDMEYCMSIAAGLVKNLDRRFLHSAGVKHRLGTVVVRHDEKTDPLREDIKDFALESIVAFRDYWNSNAREVGDTHDLAAYHVYSPPSGRAYVNSVGGANRYAISCGRGATSWADGTIAHEFGHSWNLKHNNDSGLFYEARPRHGHGASFTGGNQWHVSIMNGKGEHNIGRLSTEEAQVVLKAKDAKRAFGDLVKEPEQIGPFGVYDRVTANGGESVTVDVIANDYDSNNDVLDVQVMDTVSHQGGKITLSQGTGPGGRSELIYTPPTAIVGEDFFHYRVFDSTGRSDWGAVYVKGK